MGVWSKFSEAGRVNQILFVLIGEEKAKQVFVNKSARKRKRGEIKSAGEGRRAKTPIKTRRYNPSVWIEGLERQYNFTQKERFLNQKETDDESMQKQEKEKRKILRRKKTRERKDQGRK